MSPRRIFILTWLTTLTLFTLTESAKAQSVNVSFEQASAKLLREHNVVGASITVINNAQIDQAIHLGLESRISKAKVDKKSMFQVGSISKPVAAWAAMTLVRDGKLALDTPIKAYLQRWNIPESGFDDTQVTLRRLLSHTAGFRLGGYGGFAEGKALPSLEESLSGKTNGAGRVELFQAPGAGFSYSGGGYTLIQLLIEEVSGMAFADYVQLAVLMPLGMSDSSYQPNAELLKRRIQPHGASGAPISQHDFRAQAAAGLHTTSADLARFAIANLSANPVFDDNTVNLMHSPVANAGFADVGLGFFISSNGQLIGHGGSNFGWRAEIQFNPQTKNGLVVMTNSEAADNFLFDVKCEWDARQAKPLLLTQCSTKKTQLALAKKIAMAIAFVVLIALLSLVWALLTSKVRLAWPRTGIKRLGLFTIVSVTLFVIAFMYTPIGVYLISGFRSITATIHYAPPALAIITPWVCGLLLMSCFLFFIKRKVN